MPGNSRNVAGRMVRGPAEAFELLQALEGSGRSMSEFCRELGINWYSLNAYKGRWKKEIQAPQLVEVRLPAIPARYEVTLRNGVRILVNDDADEQALTRIARALEACWLAVHPVDMRKSFRGLSGVVRATLEQDPLSGHVFCFINRRRNMMKLLVWDRGGFWIFYRRLARGRFEIPAGNEGEARAPLDVSTLRLILDGIELGTVTRRVRYRHPIGEPPDS